MKQLFILKNPLDLAKQEVLSLVPNKHSIHDNRLIVNTSKNIANRLAYTKSVYKVLFECHKDDLLFKTNRYPWKCKTFSVKHDNTNTRNDLASIIKKKAALKLTNPEAELVFFTIDNQVIATQLTHTNHEPFESRRPHLLPAPHPAGCHPKYARAMIHLTGIQKGKILDPFCGAGGILAEASLMNLKPIGYDIDPAMIERSKINLKHLNSKAILKQKDALTLPSTSYIVTDLPYGKGTKADNLTQLYEDFFKVLKIKLKNTAVIGLPDFVDIDPMIKKSKLKVKHDYLIYIHKSLSKRIIVVS